MLNLQGNQLNLEVEQYVHLGADICHCTMKTCYSLFQRGYVFFHLHLPPLAFAFEMQIVAPYGTVTCTLGVAAASWLVFPEDAASPSADLSNEVTFWLPIRFMGSVDW